MYTRLISTRPSDRTFTGLLMRNTYYEQKAHNPDIDIVPTTQHRHRPMYEALFRGTKSSAGC